MSKASRLAYQAIRDKILSGEFAPGARLKEEEISALCGVSRTPIREALRRLSSEYFVRLVPNHGAYVSEWSAKDIEEVFTLRTLLESYAAGLAAGRMTDEVLATLTDCCDRIDARIAKGGPIDVEGFLEDNRIFHLAIRDAADSERLRLMLDGLIEPRVVIGTAVTYDEADLRRSNAYHRDLVDAFRAADAERASDIMTAHVRAAHKAFLSRENLPD